MISLKTLAVALIIAVLAQTRSPPTFNYSYQVSFEETFYKKGGSFKTTGQVFYDPFNNRERVDWDNGEHNFFCGSVLPNVATPCISLTINNLRWQIFP